MLTVQIPPGMSAGQQIQVMSAGQQMVVTIPPGAVAGQAIQVQVPCASGPAPVIVGQPCQAGPIAKVADPTIVTASVAEPSNNAIP